MQERIQLIAVMIILVLAGCQSEPLLPTATPADGADAAVTAVATAASTATHAATATLPATATEPMGTATPAPTLTPTTAPTPSPTPTAVALAMTEELALTMVAHEGGEVRSVAVDGNIAYAGVGPRLAALDVSDPAAPRQMGRSEALPGLVDALVLANDGQQTRVYAGAGDHVVALLLGTEGEVTVESALAMPGDVRALALADGLLYAGGMAPRVAEELESGFIAVIDVRQPAALALLQSQAVPRPVTSLALTKGALFYSADYAWSGVALGVLEVSDGRLGEAHAVPGVENEMYSLRVIGDTLLVGGYSILIAFDIADPLQPEQLWQVEEAADQWLGMVNGFAFAGGQLYLSGWMPAGAYIPFRRALTPPQPLGGAPGAPASHDVVASGQRLYVAEAGDLEIYDISQPGQLTQIGGYQPFPAPISDVALHATPDDELLYLYAGSPFDSAPEELFTLRLPTLEFVGQLSFAVEDTQGALSQGLAAELALGDGQAYAVARDGIYTINLDDPAAPELVGRYPFQEQWRNARGVVLMDGRLYLGAGWGSPARVAVLTPDSGGVLAQTQTGRRGRFQSDQLMAMAGAGDWLYVTTAAGIAEGWLHAVDLRDEDEMEIVAALPLPGFAEGVIAVEGDLAATAVRYEDRGNELLLIDVSAPAAPVIVSRISLAGLVERQPLIHALAFRDGRLFVVVNGQQVLVVDVTDPARPRVELALGDGTLVAANGAMGVMLFTFEDQE